MLSPANNVRITRTAPGTPMGDAMRRYWIPALLSSEVPSPDAGAVRVALLGESLLALRDAHGQVGLSPEHDGTTKIVYPTRECAGVIWAFLAPSDNVSPFQTQEWMRVPQQNVDVCKHLGDCNWLQLVEGGIDTSHSSFLHRSLKRTEGTQAYRARSTAPKLEVLTTDYGFSYAGIRWLEQERQNYVRVYQFVMPFHQMRAFEGFFGHRLVSGHIWVPADDEHTWIWSWSYTANGEALPSEVVEIERRQAGRTDDDVIPGTFRFKRNRTNDYLLDRQRQKTVNYTGIEGIAAQDQAIQESMGPIADRSREHLGSSDVAIIAARRLLLQACVDVEAGRDPLGSRLEHVAARPAEMLLAESDRWHEAMREHLVALA
jgi:phthalate 4,5-dioxygenase oxygenase subunit